MVDDADEVAPGMGDGSTLIVAGDVTPASGAAAVAGEAGVAVSTPGMGDGATLVVASVDAAGSPFGGSVIMNSESGDLPIIPLRPSAGIVITVGVLFILGGVLVTGSSALIYATIAQDRTDEYYENQVAGLALLSLEITAADYETWDQAMLDRGIHLWTANLGVLSGLAILAAGIMLVMRMRIGVWTGIGAGSFWALQGLVIMFWTGAVENDIGVSIDTQFDLIVAAGCIVCNLLCLAAAALPMAIPSARAALR